MVMKKRLEDLLKKLMGVKKTGVRSEPETQKTPKAQAEKAAEKKAEHAEEAEKEPLCKPLFTAAGKKYYFERQLTMVRIHPKEHIYKDCYGRRVLLIHERYPTFDSYDALYEDRYFHHYYIETPEGFTHVRTADDQDDIPVWEGVTAEDFIRENKTWRSDLLKAAGLIPDEKK